ncbi:hypothetical protein ACX8XO_09095 [Calditrichota bacterium LG24]
MVAAVSSFGIKLAPKFKRDFNIVRMVKFCKENEFKKTTPGAGNPEHEIRNKIGDKKTQIRRIAMIIENKFPNRKVKFCKENEFKKTIPATGNSEHEIRNKIGDKKTQIRRIEMIIESGSIINN